jgi:hypothetical protein
MPRRIYQRLEKIRMLLILKRSTMPKLSKLKVKVGRSIGTADGQSRLTSLHMRLLSQIVEVGTSLPEE